MWGLRLQICIHFFSIAYSFQDGRHKKIGSLCNSANNGRISFKLKLSCSSYFSLKLLLPKVRHIPYSIYVISNYVYEHSAF